MSVLDRAIEKLKSNQPAPAPAPAPAARPARTNAGRPHRQTPDQGVAENLPRRHVDLSALAEQGMLPSEALVERMSNEFRRIKRPILANIFGSSAPVQDNRNLVMVTSALPGDGKTFTTINLALSIAKEQDRTLLLVDADIPRGHLSKLMGLSDQPGLVELLTGEDTSVADVIVPTDIPGLRVLPAGQFRKDSPELLSSDRMSVLLEELSQRYSDRIVLFDTPPLLAAHEAQAMADHVGQICFVVRAGVTSRQAVDEALTMLDREKALNLILNGSKGEFGTHNYYGGYYASSREEK